MSRRRAGDERGDPGRAARKAVKGWADSQMIGYECACVLYVHVCVCVCVCVRARACVKSILYSRLSLLSRIWFSLLHRFLCDEKIDIYNLFDVDEKCSLGPCFALFTISGHTSPTAPPPSHTLSPFPFPVILTRITRRRPPPSSAPEPRSPSVHHPKQSP